MKYTLILLIILSTQVFTQEKFFIYFKDKGTENSRSLNKNSAAYIQAVEDLSPKAVERRIKNMGNDFVSYDDLPINKIYTDELESLGIQMIRKLSWFNSVSAYLTSNQRELIIKLPFIKAIVPVKKLYFQNDPWLTTDQHLFKDMDNNYNYGLSLKQMSLSDVPLVHSKNINGQNVLIGILDSGFDWKLHNSLKDRNVIAEYDFIFDDSVTANQPEDDPSQDNHGTYVFSVLAGFEDSILIGPAFNSSFILAKTEDIRNETHIEEDNYAAALIWMESYGVDITTSSLGYNIFDSGYSYLYSDMDGRTTIVTQAAELSYQRGVSTFTAAGNEGNNSWGYIIAPADGFGTVAVGAVDEFGNVAGFSSRGPSFDGRIKPEVAAQGVNIFGAIAGTNNGHRFANGTSAATPIASGVAALLLSAYPHLKNTQIRSILLVTSSNSGSPNNQIGYGIISAKDAIEFPNLEIVNDSYVLHKTIFEEHADPQSVKVVFIYDDIVIPGEQMSNIDVYGYSVQVPQTINGKQVEFYFTFSDSTNNNFRYPSTGEYKFKYGSDIISSNLDIPNPASDDEVTEFFPNPFIPANHKTIGLRYSSSENQLFKIVIIDGSGQTVKQESNMVLSGIYLFEWDGYSDRGYLCASGVYFASIQVGDKQFGRKFILLK